MPQQYTSSQLPSVAWGLSREGNIRCTLVPQDYELYTHFPGDWDEVTAYGVPGVYFVKVRIRLFRPGVHSTLLACSLIWKKRSLVACVFAVNMDIFESEAEV